MRHSWFGTIVATLVALLLLPACQAQTEAGVRGGPTTAQTLPVYPEATLAEWEPKFRDWTIDTYQSAMVPKLSKDEKAALAKVQFRFPRTTSDGLLAFYANEAGEIVLPVSSLLLIKDLATAEAWLALNGYSTFPLLEYLTVIRLNRLGQWPQRSRLPLAALGIPPGGNQSAGVSDRSQDVLKKTLMFVIGHELGHVLYGLDAHARCDAAGPRCNTATVRAAEARADAFAVNLLRRMRIVPSGSNFLFVVNSRLMPYPSEFADNAAWARHAATLSHPLDPQRIATVANLVKVNATSFAGTIPNPGQGQTIVAKLITDLETLAGSLGDRDIGAGQLATGKTVAPQDLLPRRTLKPTLRPTAAERATMAPLMGYFSGALRQPSGGGQPVEWILRPSPGGGVNAELMMMGIRGRINGRLVTPTQMVGTMDLGGDLYDVRLDASSDGRRIAGSYQYRKDPGIKGSIEGRRSAS